MILRAIQDERHLEPGDMIRLLDGECQTEEERLGRSHLADCPDCRRKADRLGRLSDRFYEAMFELDEAASHVSLPTWRCSISSNGLVRRLRTWLSRRPALLAAAVLVVLVLGASVTPARAWVAAGRRAVTSLLSGATQPAPEVPLQTMSTVSFVPSGEDFLIDVASIQAGGTLSVAVDTVAAASARIGAGELPGELVVLGSGLGIRNVSSSSASYALVIPSSLKAVEVRVAGRVVFRQELSADAADIHWSFDLSSPEAP